MADEVFFSTLGLDMFPENPDEFPNIPNSYCDSVSYATQCATPDSENSEIMDISSYGKQEPFKDSVYSPDVAWNDWNTNNYTSNGKC